MSIKFQRLTQDVIDASQYRNTSEDFYGYNILNDTDDSIGVIGTVKEWLYFGFIDDAITAEAIKEVLLYLGAFYNQNHFHIKVEDNPTLLEKIQEICVMEEGEYCFHTDVVLENITSELNNIHFGHVVHSDYRLTINDDVLGVVTAYGDVNVIVPNTALLGSGIEGNIFWRVYKMTGDSNKVRIFLENPEQSLVKYSTHVLYHIGDAVEIGMYRLGNTYWFTDVSTKASPERVSFTNITPTIVDGVLTMRGNIDDLSNNPSVVSHFRYRESELDPWLKTETRLRTSIGSFEITANVVGDSYQTQMVVEDIVGGEFFSTVLLAQESKPYYPSVEDAKSDGMIRVWQLQEHSSADEDGEELIDGQTMVFSGGVTSGSDTIGAETIYKRIFTNNGYGEAKFSLKKNPEQYTIMLWIDMGAISGDHTIFSTGKNIISLASDGTAIQLEVNGAISAWQNVTPFDGFKLLFVTVDPSADKTYLYDVTNQVADLKIDIHDTNSKKGIYFRLGRGASGDSNHQDNEYISDGAVRTCGIWDNVLSPIKMIDIATNLENGGLLIN